MRFFRTKAGMLLLALFVALSIELIVGHEMRELEPTRHGIFRVELYILGLILAGFIAEEVVSLLSKKQRLFTDRLLGLGYFFAAFTCSMVIFYYLTRLMELPIS